MTRNSIPARVVPLSPISAMPVMSAIWLALLLQIVACQGPAPSTEASRSAAPAEPTAATGPPNVLLIYVDDLGYGDLASYGHHTIATPHLDRLASEGMRFTNFYAPSPLCSPSRAALLTGRTPFRSGIENWIPENTNVQLSTSEETLGNLFKEHGYATHHSGKWHVNGGLDDQSHAQPDDHGFDDWITLHAFALPNHRNPVNIYRNGEALGEVEGFTAGIFTDATLDWLGMHRGGDQREAPFFVYFAPPEPHSMIASPASYNERYAHLTNGKPEPFVNGTAEPSTDLEARGPGEYYANITYLDAQIGRLLDYLDDEGLANETLVFFASDNGPVTTDWRHWWEVNLYGSTGGLRGRKADLWEGGIRVPAIARWPGHIPKGTTSDAILSAYDLLPTLASIAGFDVPADRPIDGEDFGSALGGGSFQRQAPLYWEFDDDRGFHYALRDGRYKLHATADLQTLELYDLDLDPFEVQNLVASQPAAAEEMVAKLQAIASSVEQDPYKPEFSNSRRGFRGD